MSQQKVPASLIVDTREQRPYAFTGCPSAHVDFTVHHEALPAGDYAARLSDEDAPENACVIERKSHADLLAALTRGRERFERELDRLTRYGFKALVIEADLPGISRGIPQSEVSPRAIIGSLVAFAQRYGVHVYFASDRRYAEALTIRLMERWVRDRWAAKEGGHERRG